MNAFQERVRCYPHIKMIIMARHSLEQQDAGLLVTEQHESKLNKYTDTDAEAF